MMKNTILWADDDADDLQMMKEVLVKNKKNYKIVEVQNGKEVLDYLKKSKENNSFPCMIILDINMPVLDGKETLSILKNNNHYKSIPVVVFSTSESEVDKRFCQKFDTEMVTKPSTFHSLEGALDKLLKYCT